jgi:hypothetical protein
MLTAGPKAVEDHLVWVDPVSGIAIHAFEEGLSANRDDRRRGRIWFW